MKLETTETFNDGEYERTFALTLTERDLATVGAVFASDDALSIEAATDGSTPVADRLRALGKLARGIEATDYTIDPDEFYGGGATAADPRAA